MQRLYRPVACLLTPFRNAESTKMFPRKKCLRFFNAVACKTKHETACKIFLKLFLFLSYAQPRPLHDIGYNFCSEQKLSSEITSPPQHFSIFFFPLFRDCPYFSPPLTFFQIPYLLNPARGYGQSESRRCVAAKRLPKQFELRKFKI